MDDTATDSSNLELVGRQLRIPIYQVRATVELLDEGNTVPFITRYRKDRTGGLDEEQIRRIQEAVDRQRQLEERKQKVLRSIQSQDKLSDELKEKIQSASSLKTLEDLYLPYRPKKQTLATQARKRGLEPLALEVLNGAPAAEDLDVRCAAFVDPEKELPTVDDVLAGVGHILAEVLSERVDLRSLARRGMWNGTLVSKRIDRPLSEADGPGDADVVDEETHEAGADDAVEFEAASSAEPNEVAETAEESPPEPADSSTEAGDQVASTAEPATEAEATDATPGPETDPVAAEGAPSHSESELSSGDVTAAIETTAEDQSKPSESKPPEKGSSSGAASKAQTAEDRRAHRREARRRKRQKLEQSFKDYFDHSEPIKRVPHYRVLALNRGERCKVLRVKVQFDIDQLKTQAEELVLSSGMPHESRIRESLHDALVRLVVPSIEREIRRELTDRAETHAVKVFAQNLKKLLLQPPLHHHRVLAIDPGFRSGCKIAALDEFGNVLGHNVIHVIGTAERVQQSRQRLADLVRTHKITVVAIGNGTACRETEQLVAQVISDHLSELDTRYLVVNEAGASVYSTSQMGREELPKYDATIRGAVSIGRRVLDPLSELVKIDPANIGVGLYQHDIKAKHLRASLDAVVESCVNFVGVDVNIASPALLGYVSGLNQLTARRLYEHRQANGPFRDREQLREVPGIGDATYVQAAGFLKIPNAENPLDGTWIHPESYDIARRVLSEMDCDVSELMTSRGHVPETVTVATPEEPPQEPSAEVAVASEQQPSADGVPADQEPAAGTETSVEQPSVTEAPPATVEAPVGGDTTVADDEMSDMPPAPSSEVTESPAESSSETTTATDKPPTEAPPESPAKTDSRSSVLAERLDQINVNELADKLEVGKLLLKDILTSLDRPGRDPREDLPPPVFRREILKLEDLKPGMEFSGTVLNVVDFGAFVDIGLSDSGLIHVSRLADRYVKDPHEVVSVGDILRVWVVEVDEKRRRVSLTAIQPGTEKPRQPRSSKPSPSSSKPAQKRRRPSSEHAAKGRDKAAGGRGKKRHQHASGWKPKKKPKPVVPITDAMADGSEPMRTFSDLQQFFQRKKEDDEQPGSADKSDESEK